MIFSTVPSEDDQNTNTTKQTGGIIAWIYSLLGRIYFAVAGQSKISINGRPYRVRNKIGEGGFSYVYLVVDAQNNEFAIKSIKIQLPEYEARVKNEIAAHHSVSSMHVLKLLDSEVVREGGRAIEGRLLLPYFRGGTIQNLIELEPNGLELTRILMLSIDICKGLTAFHCTPPLAYRDLKPANLLIGKDGEAILMDLGSVSLAKTYIKNRADALIMSDLCAELVTAAYRAPELFDPPTEYLITEATDIWALGCTIYAMAFGDSPFDGSLTSVSGANIRFPHHKFIKLEPLISGLIQSRAEVRPSVQETQLVLERMLTAAQIEEEMQI